MGAPISVLVVDDFPDGLDLVAEYLTFRHFAVHVATNGEDAIAIARTSKPDIVLMDLRMPGMTGWQAATILKNDPVTSGIYIIALTAHALRAERDSAIAAGCDGVILKPFDVTALADVLPRILQIGAKALDCAGLSTARRSAAAMERTS
jgi:CheY-like chemotaxis protein